MCLDFKLIGVHDSLWFYQEMVKVCYHNVVNILDTAIVYIFASNFQLKTSHICYSTS